MEITQMLDALAEYQAQVEYLNLRKQELLDEVKVPDEIQAIQEDGVKRKRAIDQETQLQLAYLAEQKKEQISTVVVPPEVQAILDDILHQRQQIELNFDNKVIVTRSEGEQRKTAIDGEFNLKVNSVYQNITRRKAEIIAEFDDKSSGALDNIAKLTAEIKLAVVKLGETVKGKFYQAVYVKGRVTWLTDMLDGMVIAFPALAKARKEGAPSVTLRKIGG